MTAAVALIAGTHNLTLLWGTIVGGLIAVIAGAALGREGLRRLPVRRVALGAAAIALGACLVAWSALPSVVYGDGTRAYADGPRLIGQLAAVDRLDVILRPYPYVPPSVDAVNPDARFQTPVYVLAWMLAAVAVALVTRRGGRMERRLAAGLLGLLALLVMLLVQTPVWRHLPTLLATIQFAFRLHAYVVIVIALLVVVALRLLRDAPGRRAWLAALVVALAAQTAIAQVSAWGARGGVGREEVVASELPRAFADYQQVMYRTSGGATAAPGRGAVATDVVASPLVRVAAPWRVAGHDEHGFLVVEGGGSRPIVAEPASPWPVVLGRLLSFTAGIVVLGWLALAVSAWVGRVRPR